MNREANEVLFCARLHPRKRVLAFLDMAEELHQRGVAARIQTSLDLMKVTWNRC